MAVGGTSRGVDGDESDEEKGDGFDDEEEEPKKQNKFFGAIKNLGSAVATAAKEHVTTSLLGDDFGEALVERMEEGNESDDDEESQEDGKTSGKHDEKEKKRGFFGLSKR